MPVSLKTYRKVRGRSKPVSTKSRLQKLAPKAKVLTKRASSEKRYSKVRPKVHDGETSPRAGWAKSLRRVTRKKRR